MSERYEVEVKAELYHVLEDEARERGISVEEFLDFLVRRLRARSTA